MSHTELKFSFGSLYIEFLFSTTTTITIFLKYRLTMTLRCGGSRFLNMQKVATTTTFSCFLPTDKR